MRWREGCFLVSEMQNGVVEVAMMVWPRRDDLI